MKKKILCIILFFVLLQGCGSTVLTGVTNSGEPYTLDKEAQKISIYNKTYSYRTDQEIFYLTYPDGAVYSVSPSGAVWYGSYNQHYALPGDLISILEKHHVEISAAGPDRDHSSVQQLLMSARSCPNSCHKNPRGIPRGSFSSYNSYSSS